MALYFCIPPANYLELMKDWPTHMVIAPHMINNSTYKQFYVNHSELSTIIDNGLWEGQVVDNHTLLFLAKLIKANEIIAPDDPSGEKTLLLTAEFLQFLEEQGLREEYVIQGAIHGSSPGPGSGPLRRSQFPAPGILAGPA